MALTLMPLRGPLVRQQAREARDAALAGGVGRDADAALERQHRGDVDDLAAAPLGQHSAAPRPATGRTPTCRLTSITSSQSRSLNSSASARRMMPALLTRMSMRPKAAHVASRCAVQSGSRWPGPRGPSAQRRPAASTAAAVCAASLRPTARCRRRRVASATAIAWPSPVLAPVTSATLPLRSRRPRCVSSQLAHRRRRACRCSPGSRRPSPR